MKVKSIALVLASVLCSTPLMAAANAKNEFSDAYQQYQQAVENQESPVQIEQYAKTAYERGLGIYDAQSVNRANLGVNYAKALVGGKNRDLALPILNDAINVLESHYGEHGIELVEPYLTKIELLLPTQRIGAREVVSKALEIAVHHKDKLLESTVYFESAKLFNIAGDYQKVKKYLNKSNRINQEHLPKNSIHRLTVDLWMAELLTSKKKYESAIEKLQAVVAIFDEQLDFEHPIELIAHSRLVNLYERVGKSEQATRHCLAIAQMRPWEDNIEQTPLYRKSPTYPRSAARARQEGWVALEFTITKEGFVDDVEVLDKDRKLFVSSAIEAVKDWRFAPKFVDGQAVEAKSQVKMIYKMR